ncbi:phosphate/phosphite/phosphonate ABC transporter substrate-binding protein [Helicobacter sp. MIT 14-3879]|uniref:phosphate/phosphite/phosphonate ABC transporter substrate-binding protein n=1 Tax=Helicobacter sp. MIT 14-3879 TaxID=2040649 RepID=UPI000E1E8B0D|nr:PhnD/SsuA/transferrin family substrate-binding protein [Helicobacter sp. MIT 14-3879]RDU64170.1 phosphate ABC transporter substrate-binding protein [Helicobacter sp. MIT 14-3879]
MKTILLGAVAYDPKVVPIWDIIRDYSNAYGYKLDYVLFSNYERQVDSLLKGHIDIAWNTNVAWIRTLYTTDNQAKALLMRDTDIGFTTKFITRKDSGIKNLSDLKGRTFGLGSLDSAQAAIMGLYYLQRNGIDLNIIEFNSPDECGRGRGDEMKATSLCIVRHNNDVGKHGDTGRSEFDILDKIKKGELDAGSIGSSTWIRILQEGSYPEIESFWSSPGYCHCNFSVMPDFGEAEGFCQMLLSQNECKNDAIIAKMMAMEGLNEWKRVGEAELRGYDKIYEAMREQGLLDNKV